MLHNMKQWSYPVQRSLCICLQGKIALLDLGRISIQAFLQSIAECYDQVPG